MADALLSLTRRAKVRLAQGWRLNIRGQKEELNEGAVLTSAELRAGAPVSGVRPRGTCHCSKFRACAALRTDGSVAVWADTSAVPSSLISVFGEGTDKSLCLRPLAEVLDASQENTKDSEDGAGIEILKAMRCDACGLGPVCDPTGCHNGRLCERGVLSFTAVLKDASVFSWLSPRGGDVGPGMDCGKSVAEQMTTNCEVQQVYSCGAAVTVVLRDGSVVEWR
mmetsp:Transcript_102624/g.320849  ORF Transcript_102624/g.320849 Transcript_102624/m.320849 type:complete len:223 (+) Transcript_102624:97-765(+)